MSENNFDCSIYQKLPQIVLGFHGCDRSTVDRVLNSPTEHLHPSTNSYDWLGDGIYFWLNDPRRAYEWAAARSSGPGSTVRHPAVIGAIIDLGSCLNLCERESILLLRKSYKDLVSASRESGLDFVQDFRNVKPDPGGYKIVRYLDRVVISHVHDLVEEAGNPFDTVYGYFQEGDAAYPGAGIQEKSHVQIAVRNTDCIKGYFLPRMK